MINEVVDEGVPDKEPLYGDEEADTQREIEESLKEGKGKEKVKVEQAVQVLLNLHTPKKKSPADQYIFQMRTSTQTEPSGHDESSSLYAELGLTHSESESDEEVLPMIQSGAQDEGQAGPNPGIQDEGHAGSNPGDAAVSQHQSSHVVHAGPNLEHMDSKVTDTSIQQNPEQMDEEFTTTAYPNEDKPGKTNTESEIQSMVTVPIHQDTSYVPLMTTPVIDLAVSQPVSTTIQAPLPTSTTTITAITTTTTSLPPIPPQPQQGSSDLILIQRIGKLEQHMADMVEANQALEERLDKQGNMLYNLENLDIPHKVSKAVDEIITDAVDWAIQAPLRDRFRDLPKAYIKEILHHRMWESNSYQPHEDHKMLTKKEEKETCFTENTTWVSTSSATSLPPPVGLSGTLGASGVSVSSQLPPPPPPPSNNQRDQSTSTAAPISLKTAVLAEYTAWTTTDTRLKPFVSSIPKELHMDDDMTPDEQVQSSGDEDIGHDHIPTVNLRQN
ncbi:hypothetical protein Tco_1395956 [Tanacetum coccineum]